MTAKTNYKTILIFLVVLLCIMSYSFITETIQSVFIRGQYFLGIICILAFIILTGGVSIFAYGGYLFFIYTVKLFKENEKLIDNIFALRSKNTSNEIKSKLRKENFHFLIKTWKPTYIYFGLAILIIVFGAIIINISDGTITIR